MKSLLFLFFPLILVVSSCDVFDNEQSGVTAQIQPTEITIFNSFKQDIYFAAHLTYALPFTQYVLVSGEENKIEAGEVRVFRNGDNRFGQLQSGQKYTVFYWFSENPYDEEVRFITVYAE
ncbi:MAG: hypothetical protein RLN81_06320 [Balneolaceae bacterium]